MPILFFLINFITLNFLLAKVSLAQCPVCIVTVGGGMLLAKKLGIDDLLVSIWISALNVAISFWLAPKIKIKYLNNKHLLSLLLLATTLFYFYFTSQATSKVLWGQAIGFLTMALANHSYFYVKSRLGHTPFPYAKVAFPLVSILFITLTLKIVFGL
jgi:hypothetical protein